MNIISKISPAATLLLISTTARLRSLLKLTLMDLVLKGVLQLEIQSKELEQAKRKIAVWYVFPGKNFEKYRPPKPYELVFLQPFFEEPIRMTFRDLVRVGFRNARGIDFFKRSVIKTDEIDKYISRSFLQRIYGGHSLTSEGSRLQNEIKSYLINADRSINTLILNDQKAALDILMKMRGNILLLRNIKYELLENIDYQQLKQHCSFAYPDDWKYYESMFEHSRWLDYFDLSIPELSDTK